MENIIIRVVWRGNVKKERDGREKILVGETKIHL